jgi:hypothetical protein
MTEPLDQTPLDDDVDFGDAGELAAGGNRISDARWERARSEVDARDVIFMLHDRRGNPMSCPFHGRDSKPSFYYFPENNTCFCYGCPDGDGYWDNVKVVARTLEITRPQALRWLEREFHLPPMGDEQEPVDLDSDEGLVIVDETEEVEPAENLLQAEDLRSAYVGTARRLVKSQAGTSEGYPLSQELLERFFTALKRNDPVPLAQVVGAEAVRSLIRSKERQG